MSFATQVRQNICKINVKRDCCRRALLYGLLLFASDFEANRIRLITECGETGELLLKLLSDLYKIEGNLYVTEKKSKMSENGELCKNYKITVSAHNDIKYLFSKFEQDENAPSHINTELFSCENCKASFLRGAFLAGGKVSDPERSYHLEIAVKDEEMGKVFCNILADESIIAKMSVRRGSEYIIYMKSSEQIENFLAYIGASAALFDLMNSRILKEANNDANRRYNCDTANLDRIVSASNEQVKAIEKLIKSGKIALLSQELRQTAELRLEYPELSIKDFGMLFDPPITKSGVSHRFKKLVEFSEE